MTEKTNILIIVLVFLLFLLLIGGITTYFLLRDKEKPIEHFSHIKTAQTRYTKYVESSRTPEELIFASNNIDLVFQGHEDLLENYGDKIDIIRYIQTTKMGLKSPDCLHCFKTMDAWFTEKGYNVEEALVHYNEPTTIQIDSENGNTPEKIFYELFIEGYYDVENKSKSSHSLSNIMYLPSLLNARTFNLCLPG